MPPLTREFLHHLDELMRETAESLRKELADHTNELIAAARKTNNSAGIPVAYSKASIDNFRTRVRATIDKYLDALENCGIAVDAVVEREMLQKIHRLTHTHGSLTLPPMLRGPNVTAVKQSHAMAMAREETTLQREGANRLRELKMKASRNVSAPKTMTQPPPPPFTIASVAPTLAGLKQLPMQQQAMLLLRRLVQIYPTVRNRDKFHKGNILLPNDNSQIAMGFPVSENMAVRQHLLGGPWNRLVVEGYLVDSQGQGFYDISTEGFAAAQEAAKPKEAPIAQPSAGQEMLVKLEHPDRPVAFMSYSWETKEHEDWVLALATRLVSEGGVSVILDKWHLRLGMDKTVFMEESIEDSDFVLLICTPEYAKKANKRRGGVGYEAMIITGELAEDIQTTKFIPVLRQGAWDKTSMPRWLRTKTGADLRGNPYNEEQFKLLVRELHGQYLKPPAPGPQPDFSSIAHAQAPASPEILSSLAKPPEPQLRIDRKPRFGEARFRAVNEPLGVYQDPIAPLIGSTESHEVYLADGPAMWLRVATKFTPTEEANVTDIAGMLQGLAVLPLFDIRTSSGQAFATDGAGYFKIIDEKKTPQTVFAFVDGEVWAIDAWTLRQTPGIIYLDERRFTNSLQMSADFLDRLGFKGPYRWIAGMEGVNKRFLSSPTSQRKWGPCMSDILKKDGTFKLTEDPSDALEPFFIRVYDQCAAKRPPLPKK